MAIFRIRYPTTPAIDRFKLGKEAMKHYFRRAIGCCAFVAALTSGVSPLIAAPMAEPFDDPVITGLKDTQTKLLGYYCRVPTMSITTADPDTGPVFATAPTQAAAYVAAVKQAKTNFQALRTAFRSSCTNDHSGTATFTDTRIPIPGNQDCVQQRDGSWKCVFEYAGKATCCVDY